MGAEKEAMDDPKKVTSVRERKGKIGYSGDNVQLKTIKGLPDCQSHRGQKTYPTKKAPARRETNPGHEVLKKLKVLGGSLRGEDLKSAIDKDSSYHRGQNLAKILRKKKLTKEVKAKKYGCYPTSAMHDDPLKKEQETNRTRRRASSKRLTLQHELEGSLSSTRENSAAEFQGVLHGQGKGV